MKNSVLQQQNSLESLNRKSTHVKYNTNIFTVWYANLLKEYATSAYGYGTIAILGQSCFASVSVMYILSNMGRVAEFWPLFQLFIVTICCIGFNATVISQQRVKVQVNALIASVAVSFLLFCANVV